MCVAICSLTKGFVAKPSVTRRVRFVTSQPFFEWYLDKRWYLFTTLLRDDENEMIEGLMQWSPTGWWFWCLDAMRTERRDRRTCSRNDGRHKGNWRNPKAWEWKRVKLEDWNQRSNEFRRPKSYVVKSSKVLPLRYNWTKDAPISGGNDTSKGWNEQNVCLLAGRKQQLKR